MKKVFSQEYTNNDEIACWYGRAPKKQFKGDMIRLKLGRKDDIYITSDEASTMIRALSAGLSHYLIDNDKYVKLKKK